MDRCRGPASPGRGAARPGGPGRAERFNTTGTGFPGTAALERRADNGCNARISGNLDQSKVTSTMSLHFIFPRQLAWDSGQRRISCLIVDASPDLTSSLLARSRSG